MKMSFEKSALSSVDAILSVCQAKIPGNGEDSYIFSVNECGGLIGVFDGCGGSGAKNYPKLRGKTGAYLASRAVAGAFDSWFDSCCREGGFDFDTAGKKLIAEIKRSLSVCADAGREEKSLQLKGTMSREFPTTAATLLFQELKRGEAAVNCIWAGDSRCYLLDGDGLAQLTIDDLDGFDAMENLTADGVLTNVICNSGSFKLHRTSFSVREPCVLFVATDGCFGYMSTPMEFEFALFDALFRSSGVHEWENNLSDLFGKYAGDDYTLVALLIGFGSFENLKKTLLPRANIVYEKYISRLTKASREDVQKLWEHYRGSYYRMMK